MSGCSLLRLQEDESERKQGFLVVGLVETDKPNARVIAFAVNTKSGRVEDFDVLEGAGSFVLSLARGKYRIFAFEDANRDSGFTKGECFTDAGSSILLDGDSALHMILRMNLTGKQLNCPYDISDITFVDSEEADFQKLQTGAVVSLNMHLFNRKYVRQGLWTPYRAFKRHGAKIYFLEKFDPAREPVLFIHGLGGSPRDLEYLIARLDRTRFQPWVYYYPSGQRLDKSAHALYLELFNLRPRLGDFSLTIVGYSLGGLVAKRFLDLHAQRATHVDRFISIATPWGGHERAAEGVRTLTVPIPVWENLVPAGKTIREIVSTPFPESTRFYQICGSGQGRPAAGKRTDGFVPLTSLYEPHVMEQARKTYTVGESHTSIVRSKEVATLLNSIISS